MARVEFVNSGFWQIKNVLIGRKSVIKSEPKSFWVFVLEILL